MKRREFFGVAGTVGLGLSLPWSLREARAQGTSAAQPYSGPFWVMLHASGGWDPTSLCDPKGRANEGERDPVNMYFRGDIRSAGNLLYAPVEGMDPFFQNYASRLLVINGIDTTTNGHDQGVRGVWSGRTAEGYPALAALIAGTYGSNLPMSLINSGGYGQTAGVARAVRLGEDANLLYRLARPAQVDPPRSTRSYFDSEAIVQAVGQARDERLQRQMARTLLPRMRNAQNRLFLARVGERDLAQVVDFLPAQLDRDGQRAQVQVALAAYRAGASVSVSLGMGGFDTHGNHDQDHLPRLVQFLNLASFVLEEADRQGVADRIVLVMGSDFGRTPNYNSGRGKDHWPITSMMLLGPGIQGNRVLGATNERHGPLKIDPNTFAPSEAAGSIKLSIEHVHRALRRFAVVPDTYVRRFPLGGQDLPIFGPLPATSSAT